MVVFVRAARVSEFQGRTLDLNEAVGDRLMENAWNPTA